MTTKPVLHRLFPLSLVLAATVVTGACEPDIDTAALGAARVAAARSRILAESAHYTWSVYAPAQSVPVATLPSLTAAPPTVELSLPTPASAPPHVSGNRLIGRLKTTGAWPPMGLGAGENYLWRDSLRGQVTPRVLVVPVSGAPMYWLLAQDGGYLGTHAPGTRALASLQCIAVCDDGCSSGHCGRDTTKAAWSVADAVDIHTGDDTAAAADSRKGKKLKAYHDSLLLLGVARKSDSMWRERPRRVP